MGKKWGTGRSAKGKSKGREVRGEGKGEGKAGEDSNGKGRSRW